MDLDAILNDASEKLLETPKPAAVASSPSAVPPEIKPWLAASANVPKEYRDKWTQLVKVDRNAVIGSVLQPSNSYRSWDSPALNTNKLVHDLVRKAATQVNYDELKTSKILSTLSPAIETDYSRQLHATYAQQILNDLKQSILSDPNYDPELFPNLAIALSK
jgi:hypothetical protein